MAGGGGGFLFSAESEEKSRSFLPEKKGLPSTRRRQRRRSSRNYKSGMSWRNLSTPFPVPRFVHIFSLPDFPTGFFFFAPATTLYAVIPMMVPPSLSLALPDLGGCCAVKIWRKRNLNQYLPNSGGLISTELWKQLMEACPSEKSITNQALIPSICLFFCCLFRLTVLNLTKRYSSREGWWEGAMRSWKIYWTSNELTQRRVEVVFVWWDFLHDSHNFMW